MAVSFDHTLRSLQLDSRKAGVFFVAGAIVLLVIWTAIAFNVRLPLSVSSVDGRVVAAAEPMELTSNSNEVIVAVPHRLGDRIAAGEVLVAFDSVSLELDLASRRQRLHKLDDELASLRREIESVDAGALSEAEEFDRALDRLRARIGETTARVEHATTAERLYGELRSERRIDALKYSEARSDLEQTRKSLEAERAELLEKQASKELALNRRAENRAQLERQEAQLAGEMAELEPRIRQLERRIEELALRAPFSGRIGAMARIAVGQTVAPGDWLLTLVPEHGYEFQAHFVAADAAGRVRPDQPVRIEFFALPWTQYGMLDARVLRVGSEERDGRVTVDMELEHTSPLYEAISHGLKGRATVLIEETTLATKLVNLLGTVRTRSVPAE